jgi:hypothetical protein
MGCKKYHIDATSVAFHKDAVHVILPDTQEIVKAYIIKQDMSTDGKGDRLYYNNYIIQFPTDLKSTVQKPHISLPIKCIFSDYTSACKELMSCEIEQNVGTLLEESFAAGYTNDIRAQKLANNRWNRFIESVIRLLKQIKIK